MNNKTHSLLALAFELTLTVGICCGIVLMNSNIITNEADKYTSEIQSDYHDLENRYVSVFKAITIHAREIIAARPTFDEMNEWLRQHDAMFRDAVGAEIYDGFAMTYRGGYARSWSYGDYSHYDPSTRRWYQEALKAGGKAVVVAPYVSYLDATYLKSDQSIELSVVQSLPDGIAFDLDLKINEINKLISERDGNYKGTTALLFTREGFILSTSDRALYSHNIFNPDKAVSADLSDRLSSLQNRLNTLELTEIDGALKYLYATRDESGNTFCILIPFREVFLRTYLPVAVGMLLLIVLEIGIYFTNRRTIEDMATRDRRISEIARAAFQQQIYVDLETMRCIPDGPRHEMIPSDDYREVHRMMRSSLLTEAERNEFDAFLAPESLLQSKNKRMVSRTFTLLLTRKDGTKVRKILEFSLFVSQLNQKLTAVILGNDVTDRELNQLRVLRSIAHHYQIVFMGNIRTGKMTPIKTDPSYDIQEKGSLSFPEQARRFAETFLRPEYAPVFIDATSLATITRRLENTEGYSITVGLRDGHWIHVRVIRCLGYDDTQEFILFVENADEQMSRQEELKKALDRATEATNAKTDFLSRMSHDIRTPMNGIMGMTRIAQQQPNPRKTADCLDKIAISSEYMLGLLNDILDMARIESGGIELHPEPCALADITQYLNSVIRPLCNARHQTLRISAPSASTRMPVLDKLRMNQIVFNLLSNAVKYTQENGTIAFTLEEDLKGDRMELVLTVQDNGKGMSPGFQKILFEPYTQEDRVRSMESAGNSSGLGLAIVKKLVEMMEGTITVDSRENEGSTFTVRLMADTVAAVRDGTTADKARDSDNRRLLSGKRVLLCEDNRINQEIARALLREAGMQVDLADNGQAGLQMFEASSAGSYDAILMDIRMPIMTGHEATRAIRALSRPDAPSVPVIAMTADAFEDDIRKSMEAGMNDHIAKPLDPKTVYAVLAAQLLRTASPADGGNS